MSTSKDRLLYVVMIPLWVLGFVLMVTFGAVLMLGCIFVDPIFWLISGRQPCCKLMGEIF